MLRQDNSTLPGSDELAHILNTEAIRPIPPENTALHFPDFASFKAILHHYNLPSDILDTDTLTIHTIVSQGSDLLDRLVPAILQNPDTSLLNAAYTYLTEEDTPHKSDLIFVFGSRTPLRAEKAAELYHQHISQKIVVSGGNPIYHSGDTEPEALRYKEILVDAGVPEACIITEEHSITLPDNVRSSLNLLEQLHLSPQSLTVVNSPYAQRRGWAVLKKHLPTSVQIYRVNADCAEEYKASNWYKQEKTLRIILNEFIKMRASVAYNTA
ncbi:MAG TPA: YdcF family protein [Candidatus Saccharimonadales bacterium]|nr:YdcF family protein [Candidatus Saccharimonadales bacterium]